MITRAVSSAIPAPRTYPRKKYPLHGASDNYEKSKNRIKRYVNINKDISEPDSLFGDLVDAHKDILICAVY